MDKIETKFTLSQKDYFRLRVYNVYMPTMILLGLSAVVALIAAVFWGMGKLGWTAWGMDWASKAAGVIVVIIAAVVIEIVLIPLALLLHGWIKGRAQPDFYKERYLTITSDKVTVILKRDSYDKDKHDLGELRLVHQTAEYWVYRSGSGVFYLKKSALSQEQTQVMQAWLSEAYNRNIQKKHITGK